MAQPTLFQSLVGQLTTFLDPVNIAFRSQTTAVNAGKIITTLSNRKEKRAASYASPPATDEEELQRYINDTWYVLHGFKYDTFAAYHGIDVEELRRVFDTIKIALHIVFGAYDKAGILANVWTMLDRDDLAPTRNNMVWPTDNLQHASALSRAVVEMTKAQPWGPHHLVVKRWDLENVASSAFLLTHRIRSQYFSLGYAVPAVQPYDQGGTYSAAVAQRERDRPAAVPQGLFTMPPLHYHNAAMAQHWADHSQYSARKHAPSHSAGNNSLQNKKPKTSTEISAPLWRPYVSGMSGYDENPNNDHQNQASNGAAASKTTVSSNTVTSRAISTEVDWSKMQDKEPSHAAAAGSDRNNPITLEQSEGTAAKESTSKNKADSESAVEAKSI